MTTTIEIPGFLTFTISIVVFFVGAGLNRLIPPLRRWNIPEAVTGGLLASPATLGGPYARLRDRLRPRSARHAASLFLHRNRAQRQGRRSGGGRPSAPDPVGADPRLSRDPEPHRGRRR